MRGPKDEAFIQSNLCRFDLDRFNAMAADIDDIVMNGGA
jgi:hypothetical protein